MYRAAASPHVTETTRSDDRATGGETPAIDERLSAVERALTGSDAAVSDVTDGAEAAAERRAIGSRLSDLEARVEELEAATQALRGYAGAVRAVNAEVERRADLALARSSRGQESDDAQGEPAASSERRAEVPTPSALDAAVPPAPVSEGGDARLEAPRPHGRTDGADAADRSGEAGDGDESDGKAWSCDALERLRETL